MGNDFTTTAASGATTTSAAVAPTTDVDILSASQNPKKVRTEEGFVEEHSISDKILAAQHDAAANATAPPHGMHLSKFKPGSALGGTP